MILAVDIGNTITQIGAFEEDVLLFSERFTARRSLTDFEAEVMIRDILSVYQRDAGLITGAIIASVVADVTPVYKSAIKKLCGVNAKVVGPGLKTGLHIKLNDPAQLGADLAAQAAAAVFFYTAPMMIVDFGTAISIGVIDKEGCFIGGFLCPGLSLSSKALSERAAALPHVGLERPKRLIGTNTADCLKSGLIYGTASMIDGLIERTEEEMGTPLSCVATGSAASLIASLCKRDMTVDEHLLMKGLNLIYNKN